MQRLSENENDCSIPAAWAALSPRAIRLRAGTVPRGVCVDPFSGFHCGCSGFLEPLSPP